MKDTIEINSIKHLYKRIKPALSSKCNELKRLGIYYVKEADIWNYLSEKKCRSNIDLRLSQMVSDIFDTDNYIIRDYALQILKNTNRIAKKTNEDLL